MEMLRGCLYYPEAAPKNQPRNFSGLEAAEKAAHADLGRGASRGRSAAAGPKAGLDATGEKAGEF